MVSGSSGPTVLLLRMSYARVPQAARNPKSSGMTAWLISSADAAVSPEPVESLDGLDGLAERPDLDQSHGGTHTVEIAAIAGRDEERRSTRLLGCGDLLLNAADGLDIYSRVIFPVPATCRPASSGPSVILS